MNIVVNEFTNMIINILLFSIVPFGWYVVTLKTTRGFLKETGLFLPKSKHIKEMLLIFTGVYIVAWLLLFLSVTMFQTERELNMMQNFSNPLYFFLCLLFYGIKTGLAEEIFFRGFLAKKLIKRFDFVKGNILQSLCFALPHIISISQMSPLDTAIRIINAVFLGWVFGYIMSKKANDSIVPCVLAHIVYNMISSFFLSLYLT